MSGDMRRSSDGLVGDAVKDLHAKGTETDWFSVLHFFFIGGHNSVNNEANFFINSLIR